MKEEILKLQKKNADLVKGEVVVALMRRLLMAK